MQRGSYNFHEIDFQVLPHALRVVFPDEDGDKIPPRSDFSNLSDWIDIKFMDVKVSLSASNYAVFVLIRLDRFTVN